MQLLLNVHSLPKIHPSIAECQKAVKKSGNGRVQSDEVVRAWEEIKLFGWKRKPPIVV